MPRRTSFGFDLLVIVVGMFFGAFVAGVFSTSLPLEVRLTLILAGCMAGGAAGFFLMYLSQSDEPPILATPAEIPRQVAGNRCATCDEYLLLATDGHFCDRCGEVYCKKCVPVLPCPNCQAK